MRKWAWLVLPLAFLLMSAGWAVTSPAGSSPDDDYHLASIWCAAGEESGRCQRDPSDPQARLVPANVVGAADCYRFRGDQSAACTRANSTALVSTIRVNETAGLYPSGFYRLMGLLVGPDVDRSVLLMRLLNSLIAALVLAAMIGLTPRGVSSAASIAILATFVPLGLFIAASTNPSSWTMIGIAGFWAMALAWLRTPTPRSRRGVLLGVATLATAALGILSRVDANAYVVLTAIIVLILAVNSRAQVRASIGRLLVIGGICIAAFAQYLSVSSTSLVIPGMNDAGGALGSADAGIGLLMTNLVYLPVLFQGIVGGTPLGWFDTTMPPLIPVVGTLVVGALLYRGMRQANRRTLIAAGLAAAALILVPILFLQAQHLGVGEVVQPRYLLPLLTILVATISVGPRFDQSIELRRAPAFTIAAPLVISATLAFWANAQRYLIGSAAPLFDRGLVPEWQPLLVIPVGLIAVITALATAVFVAGVMLMGVTEPLIKRGARHSPAVDDLLGPPAHSIDPVRATLGVTHGATPDSKGLVGVVEEHAEVDAIRAHMQRG